MNQKQLDQTDEIVHAVVDAMPKDESNFLFYLRGSELEIKSFLSTGTFENFAMAFVSLGVANPHFHDTILQVADELVRRDIENMDELLKSVI